MGLKPENFFFASGREFMGGGLKPGKDISPVEGFADHRQGESS